MGLMQRLVDRAYAKLSGFPQEWMNPNCLAAWEADHADPYGSTWCVMPPEGEGWSMYGPGSRIPNHPWPYHGVAPAATSDRDDDREVWLRDVEPWMRPWIEQISGGRVVDIVEGLTFFGPNAQVISYAIYARVV